MVNLFLKNNRFAKLQVIQKWVSKYAFEIIIITLGVCILFSPPNDPDFGWHFKYGEYFWQHLSLLRENIFSYTLTEHKFANSYFIAQVIIYFLYHNFGNVVGSMVPSTLLSLVLLAVAKKAKIKNTAIFLWFVAITTALSLCYVSVRPLLYSTVFLYVLLYALIFDKKLQKYLPFLFLVWANTHADFVLGLFIYGVYTLDLLIKRDFNKLIYPISSVFMTLINVNGLHLWTTIISELVSPFNAHVHEWSALITMKADFRMNLLVFGTVFLIGGLVSRKTREIGLWYQLLVIFFFLFGLKSVYMLRIVFILGSVGLLYVADYLEELVTRKIHFWVTNVFLIGFTYLTIMGFVFRLITTTNTKLWTNQAHYPYEAVRYLATANLNGNILNNYDWGGYLIWQLPQHKTFIDGRMTSWKEGNVYFMDNYFKITKRPQNNTDLFNAYVERYNIRYVLDKPDSTFVKYLTNTKANQWQLIFTDDNAVVLEKKD